MKVNKTITSQNRPDTNNLEATVKFLEKNRTKGYELDQLCHLMDTYKLSLGCVEHCFALVATLVVFDDGIKRKPCFDEMRGSIDLFKRIFTGYDWVHKRSSNISGDVGNVFEAYRATKRYMNLVAGKTIYNNLLHFTTTFTKYRTVREAFYKTLENKHRSKKMKVNKTITNTLQRLRRSLEDNNPVILNGITVSNVKAPFITQDNVLYVKKGTEVENTRYDVVYVKGYIFELIRWVAETEPKKQLEMLDQLTLFINTHEISKTLHSNRGMLGYFKYIGDAQRPASGSLAAKYFPCFVLEPCDVKVKNSFKWWLKISPKRKAYYDLLKL